MNSIINRTPAMQAHFRQMKRECALIKAGTSRLSERDQLIVSHYLLAVSIASQYKGKGLEMEDLIGFAYIGLTRAADRFRPERHIAFATFASFWCRTEVLDGLTACGHPIRLPKYRVALLTSVRDLQSAFFLRHGREPQPSEIAELLDQDEAVIRDLLAASEPFQPMQEEDLA